MHFLNPLFLIGLFAVAVPILIHLFSFRLAKKVIFSNVFFLQDIQKMQQKMSQFKHLIILLFRILAIVFLVLAFARPYFIKEDQTLHEGTKWVCVYIDNSYSMQVSSDRGRLIDEAKQIAKDIVSNYQETDKFCLLTNEMEGRHQHFMSREDFLTYVEEVDCSASIVPLSILIKKLQKVPSHTSQKRELFLISDFQRSIVDVASFPADSAMGQVHLIPLKANAVNNVYVDSVFFERPIVSEGDLLTIHARVVNVGDHSLEKLALKLMINGEQRAIASVDLQAHESKELPFSVALKEKGVLQAQISLSDFPVVFDDQYYFTIQVQDKIAVSTLSSMEGSPFLDKLFGKDSAFVYRSYTERSLDYGVLVSSNFFIMSGVEGFSSGLQLALQKAVSEGLSLLIIPSAKMDREQYNKFLHDLPSYGEYKKGESFVGEISRDSYLFKGVFESWNDHTELPFVKASFRIEPSRRSSTEVLMRLRNGDPFLTMSSVGKGRVYLLASPVEETNLFEQALFIPMLYNMALYSRPYQVHSYPLDYSGGIEMNLLDVGNEPIVRLRSMEDGDEVIPEIRKRESRYYLFIQNMIKKPGNYGVEVGKLQLTGVSFNYSRQESDPKAYEPSELSAQLEEASLHRYKVSSPEKNAIRMMIHKNQQENTLWKYFVLLSLLCVLAEILLLLNWTRVKRA